MKKFNVTVVKMVEFVTELTIEAENEEDAERQAERLVSDDERNVPGTCLQWDEGDTYSLEVPEIHPC